MHINIFLSKKRVLTYVQLLLLVIFFGGIGYSQIFYNETEPLKREISFKLDAIAKASSGVSASDIYGTKRASIALQEYNRGVVEERRGCNCGERVNLYTQGQQSQWCTMFASWVTKEAGNPLRPSKPGKWKLDNSREFSENLQKNGSWYGKDEVSKNNLKPKLGDYVVFWRGDFESNLGHVDVVVEVQKDSDAVGLVGGNLDDRVTYRNLEITNYYGFLGFGRPETD